MKRWAGASLGTLMVLWMVGCDCSGPHDPLGPCARLNPPPSCEQSCGESGQDPCPLGFYCTTGGMCTQDCDPLTPDANCYNGNCTEDGHCIGRERPDADVDANLNCADIRVQAQRVTPNVVIIVDQSGSMTQGFGGSNRWDALRDSLLAQPDGFVSALQGSVRFGLAMYSARAEDNMPAMGMCPLIEWVPPALDNFAAINTVYGPADPIDETPTGQSIDAVINLLNMTPDPSTDPTIFILATDGEPDTCEVPNPQNGQPQAIAAVERAHAMGIRTFVISVGRDVSMSHLQDVANAGVGASGMNAPFWVAGDDMGLRDALGEIIGGQLSCVVTLSGRIDDLTEACTGRVELNGLPLACDDPNGWRAVDETHIELQGDACTTLQNTPGVTLEATFPCGIILI